MAIGNWQSAITFLMRVVPISLPTPFYIGPVNVYLIAEDPLTIIDTGPKTKEAIDALRAGLRKAGYLVSDLRRIVLTHAHEDPDQQRRIRLAAPGSARVVARRAGGQPVHLG